MIDKEYLARPELDVKFEYNKSHINIASEHTCYVRHEKMIKLNQKELLDSYSNIIKLCREMGIKIKYSFKYKKFISENWQEYIKTYREYDEKFNHLLTLIPQLQNRGIHQGNSDDMYLKSVIEYSHSLDSYYYRNNVLSQMSYIYHELGKIENELKFEKNCKKPDASLFGKTVSLNL